MGMGPFARFLAMRAMQQAAPPVVPDYSGSLSGGVYGPTTGMPPAPPMAMAGPPGGIPPAIQQAMLAQAMVAAAQQAQGNPGNPGAMARPRPYSRWGDTIGSVNSTASPVVPADPNAIQTSSPAAAPVTPEQAAIGQAIIDAKKAALLAQTVQTGRVQPPPPQPLGTPGATANQDYIYAMPENTRSMASDIQSMPDAGFGSNVYGSLINAAATGITTGLNAANSVMDKGRLWQEEKRADGVVAYVIYQYGTKQDAIDAGLIPATASDQEWETARAEMTARLGRGQTDNPDLVRYLNMSPEEQKKFAAGLLDAYKNGYTAYGGLPPGATQGSIVGQAEQRPIVGQWGPGSRAAHEYIAGTMAWYQRLAADIESDPTNTVLPFIGEIGGPAIRAGGEFAAKGAAEGGFKGAVQQIAGRVVQAGGVAAKAPDVVLNTAADKVIGGTIDAATAELRDIPFIGKAMKTPTSLKGRFAAEDGYQGLTDETQMAGQIAASDIGGTAPTPPGQTAVPPEPGAGPMGGVATTPPNEMPDVLGGPGANQGRGLPRDQYLQDVAAGETNLYEPVPGGDRLVDQPANGARTGNDDLRIKADAFEAANKDKRAAAWERDREIESQIKQKQREAEALKQQRDQLKGPERKTAHDAAQTKYAEAESLKADQKINGVEHTVYDVARDYRDAFHDLPEIPVTAKRIEPPRAMGDDLEGLVGGDRTPNGNRVGSIQPPRDAQQAYTITGKGGEKTKIVKGADGKWTVTKGGDTLAEGVTKTEAIRVSDANLEPAELPHGAQQTPWLIERAVYADDQGALNILKERLTPEQYERVEQMRADLQKIKAGEVVARPTEAASRGPIGQSFNPIPPEMKTPVEPAQGGRVAITNDKRFLYANEKKAGELPEVLNVGYLGEDGKLTSVSVLRNKDGYYLERDYHYDQYPAVSGLTRDEAVAEAERRARIDWAARKRQADWVQSLDASASESPPPRAEPIGAKSPPPEPTPQAAATPPARPSLHPSQLPTDLHDRLYRETFTGASEPLYRGKNLVQVRDSIEPAVIADQTRARQLVREIRDGKVALGLDPETPLDVPVRKGQTRPVVEVRGEGPGFKKGAVPGSVSSTDLIAKEKELTALRIKYPEGRYGDIVEGDTRDIANRLAANAKRADVDPSFGKRHGKLHDAGDVIHALTIRNARHMATSMPAYSIRNEIGNLITSTVGTAGRNADMMIEHFRTIFRRTPGYSARYAEDAGLRLPEELVKDTPGGLDLMGSNTDTPARQLAKKLKVPEYGARFGDTIKRFNAAVEYAGKVDLAFMPIWRGLNEENMAALAERLTNLAAKRGADFTEGELTDLIFGLRKTETRIFSSKDLNQALTDAALERGMTADAARRFAQTGSQEWQHMLWNAREEAIRQTNRIFPGIRRMTNADRLASQVFFFHLWPTRQARFVLEEMVRHPQLYHLYREAHRGLERMAEEGDYPASAKMLMRIGDSPYGFTLFANPASLFLVSYLNPDNPTQPDPEGMTWLGHNLKAIKDKTGLGVIPFFDAMLNVAGVYGDSFPPQPWPSQTVDLAQAAVDYALTGMGHHPTGPVWQNAMVALRGWASGIVPGTSKVRPSDQGAYTMDVIGSIVLDNNPQLAARMAATDAQGNPTPDALAARGEFGAIMDDEEDPEYVKAEKQAAGQNFWTRLVNAISPFSIKAKMTSREDTLDLAKAGRAAKTAGQEPTPLEAGAMTVRNAVTQTPEANALDAQLGEYRSLGTDRQRSLAQGWALIAYPDGLPDGQYAKVGGHYYSKTQLAAMDQDARYALADSWVAEVGGTAEYADYRGIRSAFLDDPKHAELKKYDAYKDAITKSPLGAEQWIALTRAGNPNYDAYLTEQEQKYGQAALDAAFTPGAYLAWKGAKSSLYEANPESVRDTSNVPFDANETVGGGGASTATAKSDTSVAGRAARLDKSIAVYNAKVAALQPYLPQGTRWESMSPTMRSAYTDSLRRQGISIPSMPGTVANYNAWVATRAPGDDTSTIAYVRWADSMDAALGLPAGTTIPEEAMGMDTGAGPTLPTYGYADPIGAGGYRGYVPSYRHSVG